MIYEYGIKTADWCEATGRELSDEMLLAAFYLEAKGLHLFVDFDFVTIPGEEPAVGCPMNALQLAEQMYSYEVA